MVLQTSNFNGFKDSTSKKFLKTQYFKNTVTDTEVLDRTFCQKVDEINKLRQNSIN